MITTPARQAINYALNNDWEKALQANLEILETNPSDIHALLRTAKAYYQLGNSKKARQYGQKVLDIDSANQIAQKCMHRWQNANGSPNSEFTNISTRYFLEEPGRTKIIPLIHLADYKTLASIDCGQPVNLHAQKRKITISTVAGDYIGRIADDIASIVHYAIEKGHEFDVFVKSIAKDEVKIFVRETKGAKVFSKSV